MGRSFWEDLGIGIVTGVIGTAVVATVLKCIKAMRKILKGQPENPVAVEQCEIDLTWSSPPTSSPASSSFNRELVNQSSNTSSSPPTSPTPIIHNRPLGNIKKRVAQNVFPQLKELNIKDLPQLKELNIKDLKRLEILNIMYWREIYV